MGERIHIRSVETYDNRALASLIRKVFHEHNAPKHGTVYSDTTTDHLFELFEKENAIFWVAEVDGQVVGCCSIYPTEGLPEGCAELVKFYLLQQFRGIGIGKALMEKSINSAIEFGYSQLYIESLPVFSKAVQMYEKSGFNQLERPLGASGHTSCNIWMIKDLTQGKSNLV